MQKGMARKHGAGVLMASGTRACSQTDGRDAGTVQWRHHNAQPSWLTSPVRPKSPAPEGAPAAAAGDLAAAAAEAPPGAAPLQRQEAQSSCSAAA